MPPIGHEKQASDDSATVVPSRVQPTEASAELQALENQAHHKRVLLSSDALQHFVALAKDDTTSTALLEKILDTARVSYASEDGWVVLNLERMHTLCKKLVDSTPVAAVDTNEINGAAGTVGLAVSSLAEAIVTGNVVAAYQLIDNRPMIALAEASSDLDALYRYTQGEKSTLSTLLQSEAKTISTEAVTEAIAALTSALDGTYDDEEAAVKIAVMKAIKALQ